MKEITTDILFEELPGQHGNLGLITLNRPQALNALNHSMFIALDEHLTEWQNKKTIKAVVIRAVEGRAFCAGGDIRAAYEKKLANDASGLQRFFKDEYQMNERIHHFSKPYIALLDGITMGGGAGISLHGSHCVATPRLSFAMPETGIGFYPDVGTTYYLARMPSKVGFYLGLTGARISYADCAAIGIVQHVVAEDTLAKIITALSEASITSNIDVTQILNTFSLTPPPSSLLEHQNEIETCFSHHSIENILFSLDEYGTEWCQQTAKTLRLKSPTSLKVTLKALQEAEKYDFDQCMKMEYNLTCHFLESHGFFEGIRAAIIDKDQKPHWKPSQLSEVTAQDVDKYFT